MTRHEWRTVVFVVLGVLGLLAVLSYSGERAALNGVLGGVGWRYLQGVVLVMMIYAVFAMGLNLEFGFTGLLNFGHVLFLSIGAYTASVLTWKTGDAWDEAGLLAAVGMCIAIVIVASAVSVAGAILVGIPTLRLREDYLAITTIGGAEIVRTVWLNETWLTNGPRGLTVRMPGSDALRDPDGWWRQMFEGLSQTGIDLDPYFAFLTLVAAGTVAATYWILMRLQRSSWGRVVRAIRENEEVAAALGKPVFRVKLQSLAVGSVIASWAGILFAWYQRFITPASFLPLVTFYAWIIVVVGGTSNHRGTIAGSVILWGLFEAARQLDFLAAIGIDASSGPQQVLAIGVLLIIIMLYRPQGMLGRKEELHGS